MKLTWQSITVVFMFLLVGIVAGYGVRAATSDYNNVNQYCYVTGTETIPSGIGVTYPFNEQYHLTCSSQPLPQTP